MPAISPIETAARKEKLLEVLPLYDWSITKAGIAVGWKPSYAKTRLPHIIAKDVNLCQRIREKRQALDATTGDMRVKVERRLMRVVDSPTAADRDAIKAGEVLGKMSGWMTETIRMETSERQQQLDAAKAAAAKALAAVLLDTRRLPGEGLSAHNTQIVPNSPPAGGETEVIDASFVPNTPENSPNNAPAEQAQSGVKADAEPAAGEPDAPAKQAESMVKADADTTAGDEEAGPVDAVGPGAGEDHDPADEGPMPPRPGGCVPAIMPPQIFPGAPNPTSAIDNKESDLW